MEEKAPLQRTGLKALESLFNPFYELTGAYIWCNVHLFQKKSFQPSAPYSPSLLQLHAKFHNFVDKMHPLNVTFSGINLHKSFFFFSWNIVNSFLAS